jgi:hypothetical protein
VRALAAVIVASSSAIAQSGAQRPPADSSRADTAARQVDVARDTVKTPFVVSNVPVPEGTARKHWSRDQIFQTGAVNAAELIALVPGASIMRSGFVMAPQAVTWMGETGRVRVFLDGIELDALNPRDGTVGDLAQISVWELEEVIAEATPAELRVHLRTWRVARTTPETRVDVLTGDAQTNLYRGFFGRRFQSGLGMQFGFEQVGTQQRNRGGDGDGLSLFARLGWASGDWSVDLTALRTRRSRNATPASEVTGELPPFVGQQLTPYIRIGFRNPESSAIWAQLIATRDAFQEKSPFTLSGTAADSADTTVVRPQYVAAAGVRIAGIQLSATARMRHIEKEDYLSPSVRALFERNRLSLYAYGEHGAHDSTLRVDAGLRFAAIANRLAVEGGAAIRRPIGDNPDSSAMFVRAGLSVRLGGLWFSGGVIQRDSVVTHVPAVFEAGIIEAASPSVMGETFGISGSIYKDFGIDVHGTVWENAGHFRPRNEIAGRIYLESDWRSRFPKGDFTIRASFYAEHRGEYTIPLEGGDVVTTSATPVTSTLEIRIKSATISWQFRNLFGAAYETVPGFEMPSRLNLYGVRWNFTN